MLALMLTLAVNTATPHAQAPAAGTYAYTTTLNGTAIGKTSLAISQSGGVTTIVESESGTLRGLAVSASATMTLSATLDPTSYTAKTDAGAYVLNSALTIVGDTATLSGTNARVFTLAEGEKHFAILDGSLLSGFAALPAQAHAWGADGVRLLAPTYAQSAPLSFDAVAKPPRPAGVPATDVRLSIATPLPFTEWYDPSTLVLDELDVPSQNFVFSRVR